MIRYPNGTEAGRRHKAGLFMLANPYRVRVWKKSKKEKEKCADPIESGPLFISDGPLASVRAGIVLQESAVKWRSVVA